MTRYPDSDPNGSPLRRLVNRIGRPFGINPFPRAFENALRTSEAAETFDRIYQENHWGSAESRSGVGSERGITTVYLSGLRELLRRRGFTSLFDAPCGDLNWIGDLIHDFSLDYSGGDISAAVIEHARDKFPEANLRLFDIVTDSFPTVEVWHCRDCLFHLPFAAIFDALSNFVSSEVPFALLTTHRARFLHRNLDVGFGGFRFLDLERAPFNLPSPIERIDDYVKGSEFPRYVCLWSREQIAHAISSSSPEYEWRHD